MVDWTKKTFTFPLNRDYSSKFGDEGRSAKAILQGNLLKNLWLYVFMNCDNHRNTMFILLYDEQHLQNTIQWFQQRCLK